MQGKQDQIRFRFEPDNKVVREDGGSLLYSAARQQPAPRLGAPKGAQLKKHARAAGGTARGDRRILSAAIRDVQIEMRRERAATPAQADTEHQEASRLVKALADGGQFSPTRRQRNHAIVLLRGFQARRKLLDKALTSKQVATLLGASRQMPLDRLKANGLVAARDAGDWRFPPWQFDPMGPDGVVTGLPAILAALPSSGLQRIAWLSTPHPGLGMAPIDALRKDMFEHVLSEAQAVGAG